MARAARVACEVCGREIEDKRQRYTSIDPDTGRVVHACSACDLKLAEARDRLAREATDLAGSEEAQA